MKMGGNINILQKHNRCKVLEILLKSDKISRIDLARMTGLNKATITSIINDFLDMGIVNEIGPIRASNGRKTAGLSQNFHDTVVIVVRINRYELNFALCDISSELTHMRTVPYNDESDIHEILLQIESNIHQMIKAAENKKIMGISVAILGWVFQHEGRFLAKPDIFQALGMVDIKKELENMFKEYKVLIDHDANLSAIAEWNVYTKNTDISKGCMLNIVGGIGFGGGIIINGVLFRGKNGVAGEVGHMGINLNAYKYSSTSATSTFQGIWEDYASPRALHRSVMEHMYDMPDTELTERSTIFDIYSAYEKDDPLAVWAVNRSARYLAYGLTSLVYILNPDVIVLGDEIIRSERFLAEVKKHLKHNLPIEIYNELDIRFSGVNGDAILIGAGIAMVKEYLESFEMIDFIKEHYSKQ